MFGKTKNEEVTTGQAIVELSKGIKVVTERLDALEKKKETREEVIEEPKKEKKIQKKQEQSFVLQEMPTQTDFFIVDTSDPENQRVLNLNAAVVELLNRVKNIETMLS